MDADGRDATLVAELIFTDPLSAPATRRAKPRGQ
jgi:hypothetical protein